MWASTIASTIVLSVADPLQRHMGHLGNYAAMCLDHNRNPYSKLCSHVPVWLPLSGGRALACSLRSGLELGVGVSVMINKGPGVLVDLAMPDDESSWWVRCMTVWCVAPCRRGDKPAARAHLIQAAAAYTRVNNPEQEVGMGAGGGHGCRRWAWVHEVGAWIQGMGSCGRCYPGCVAYACAVYALQLPRSLAVLQAV